MYPQNTSSMKGMSKANFAIHDEENYLKMTIAMDEHTLFRNVPTKSVAKGDVTNEAARTIIRAEKERQYAKTASLREARLAFEAQFTPDLPKARARLAKEGRRTSAVPA